MVLDVETSGFPNRVTVEMALSLGREGNGGSQGQNHLPFAWLIFKGTLADG